MNEKRIDEYLKNFDEEFGTDISKKVNIEEMKIMKVIFQHLIDKFYQPTEKCKKLQHKHIKLSDDFVETLNENQKKMFFKLEDIEIKLAAQNEEQFFMIGSIFTRKLDNELKV